MRTPLLCLALALGLVGCDPGPALPGSDGDGAAAIDSPVYPTDMTPQELRFRGWLDRHARVRLSAAEELYTAYYDADDDRPWFVSTMVSADVLRFYLGLGDIDAASRIGDGLLRFQHPGDGAMGDRLAGAFPSAIEESAEGWTAGAAYDSADNLAIIEALLDLHDATDREEYRTAAVAAAIWIRDVMTHGERWGLWLQAYGIPMRGMNADGAFDNRIPVGRTLFWLPTLRRLSSVTGDREYAKIADRSLGFLTRGQRARGGFPDRYAPGWPPKPYALSRFEVVGIDGSVYADDSLRAALGLVAEHHDGAARFAIEVDDDGGVPGYIDVATGDGLFAPGDAPYHDVVASALYRELARALGRDTGHVEAFLAHAQAANGGWYWGRVAADGAPVTHDQATLTGLWALADLRPRGPETW